jgi:hypothetical protein
MILFYRPLKYIKRNIKFEVFNTYFHMTIIYFGLVILEVPQK